MANQCNYIEYFFIEDVISIEDNTINLKPNINLNRLDNEDENEFSENASIENGNIYIEQSLKVTLSYSDVLLLQTLQNRHLILKLYFKNKTLIWGSKTPYNPVQIKISTVDAINYLEFTRISDKPEL